MDWKDSWYPSSHGQVYGSGDRGECHPYFQIHSQESSRHTSARWRWDVHSGKTESLSREKWDERRIKTQNQKTSTEGFGACFLISKESRYFKYYFISLITSMQFLIPATISSLSFSSIFKIKSLLFGVNSYPLFLKRSAILLFKAQSST